MDRQLYEECEYTIASLSLMNGVNRGTIRNWIEGGNPAKRMQETYRKVKEQMESSKIKKHPSYGYATEQQIARLNEIGIGHERDQIMAAIAKQTKNRGKK